MLRWLRALVVLALVVPWALPALGQGFDTCETVDMAPPGSLAITKGQVGGGPGEKVFMTNTIPREGAGGTRVGYLITGDHVDFVVACRGFSYVRYHGEDRTTAGWIDSRRLRLEGQAFIPLPSDASRICSDAQREANGNALTLAEKRDIPPGVQLTGEDDEGQATPINYQLIEVQGRPLAIVQMAEWASCSSVMATVWTGDLKRRLSPDDVVSRNPSNLVIRSNAWSMALSEDVVMVDRQPLIRSTSHGENFELSRIDKTGDTQLLCHGRLRPQTGKPIVTEGDPGLCGTLPLATTPVAMQSARGRFAPPPKTDPRTTQEAVQWGMADLDNTGDDRPIGVVKYTYASSAGCGSDFVQEVPVLLHGEVVSSDQVSTALKVFHGKDVDYADSSEKLLVRIVRLGDQTYVELLDAGLLSGGEAGDAPVQSIWKFEPSGAKQICKYQTRHYEMVPPSINESGVSG